MYISALYLPNIYRITYILKNILLHVDIYLNFIKLLSGYLLFLSVC